MSPEAFVMMMTVWGASLLVVVPLFIIEGREEREVERKQAGMKKCHHSEER